MPPQLLDCLVVSPCTLAACLALFLLVGCLGTGVSGFGSLTPLVLGTAPSSDPDDHVWRYIFAALVPALFWLKYKAFKYQLVDLEIIRIKGLDRPFVFLFYAPLKLLALAFMITASTLIHTFTPQNYYKDLVFATLTSAVCPLLGACCFFVARETLRWTEEETLALPIQGMILYEGE